MISKKFLKSMEEDVNNKMEEIYKGYEKRCKK